jgi:Fe-Mn family superoxide dismutase
MDALAPVLDKTTLEFHYGKHHQTYVTNLNKALEPFPELQKLSFDELLANKASKVPEAARQAVINNGGGVANHNLYWQILGPKAGGEPGGELGNAIKSTFGSFATFKEKLSDASVKRFGSGWGWLVKTPDGKLEICSTANQDSPVSEGKKTVMVIDVWEHAYYLMYQNRRPDYVNAIWGIINWAEVAKRFGRS